MGLKLQIFHAETLNQSPIFYYHYYYSLNVTFSSVHKRPTPLVSRQGRRPS